MLYGEHLSADEVPIKCTCGVTATVEIFDKYKCSCGWYCRSCGYRKSKVLRRQEKLAKAIIRKQTP